MASYVKDSREIDVDSTNFPINCVNIGHKGPTHFHLRTSITALLIICYIYYIVHDMKDM